MTKFQFKLRFNFSWNFARDLNLDSSQRLGGGVAQVVEHVNLVALRLQQLDHRVRADVAAAARQQHLRQVLARSAHEGQKENSNQLMKREIHKTK